MLVALGLTRLLSSGDNTIADNAMPWESDETLSGGDRIVDNEAAVYVGVFFCLKCGCWRAEEGGIN